MRVETLRDRVLKLNPSIGGVLDKLTDYELQQLDSCLYRVRLSVTERAQQYGAYKRSNSTPPIVSRASSESLSQPRPTPTAPGERDRQRAVSKGRAEHERKKSLRERRIQSVELHRAIAKLRKRSV